MAQVGLMGNGRECSQNSEVRGSSGAVLWGRIQTRDAWALHRGYTSYRASEEYLKLETLLDKAVDNHLSSRLNLCKRTV